MSRLNDAYCMKESIRYDDKQHTLDITFKRLYYEDPAALLKQRFLFIFQRVGYPLILCQLHLDGVLTCEIKNNGGPDYDIFSAMDIAVNFYTMNFVMDLKLGFTLSENLTGYLKDLNQIDGEYEYTLERR